MKKNLTLVFALIAFASILIGSSTIKSALIISCVVLVSCILTALIIAVFKKLLTPDARICVAVLVGATIALCCSIVLAAYAYGTFKLLSVLPAALCAAAAMATVYGSDNADFKCSVLFAVSLLIVSVISGLIREVFGLASIAGTPIQFLSGLKCSILATTSGGFIIGAIVLACIRKILPACVRNSLSSDELPFFMTSRFSSQAIPAAFAGVPSLILVLSIISMVLYAYI